MACFDERKEIHTYTSLIKKLNKQNKKIIGFKLIKKHIEDNKDIKDFFSSNLWIEEISQMYYLYCPYQGPSCNTQWGIEGTKETPPEILAINEIPRQILSIYYPTLLHS